MFTEDARMAVAAFATRRRQRPARLVAGLTHNINW